MNSQEAQEKYREASRLYGENRFAEALTLLDELGTAYPGNKNVLYAQALSLAALGREDEALTICDRLCEDQDDQRAAQLKTEILTGVHNPQNGVAQQGSDQPSIMEDRETRSSAGQQENSVEPSGFKVDFAYTKNPQSLTSFLVAMLWVALGFEIMSILSDFAQLSLLDRGFTFSEAEANDARQQLIGIGYFAVYVVTGIVFLMWIYRANLNCRGFGAQDMRFTPGWSVGYYFVPFLNLIRPYQSMKEIWQVSHNPSDWQSPKGSALIGWWWALWLLSGFLGQMFFRLSMSASTADDMVISTRVSILSSLIGIPLCLVSITLIKAVYRKQEVLVENGLDT